MADISSAPDQSLLPVSHLVPLPSTANKDESRVKVTVMEVQPVDHREYSRRLLQDIYKLAR